MLRHAGLDISSTIKWTVATVELCLRAQRGPGGHELFGDILLLEGTGGSSRQARRLSLGVTGGRDEAWLRDTLFAHPEVLPMQDLEPSFGPLVPLCRELRTEAGPLDIAFINPQGRLTLVECKLWRNPEARRKVVAQTLDYARAISRWSYADLQRQVSAATGRKGNLPFEAVRTLEPDLEEHRFADAVTRALRAGRFLLLIAGDGIREDVGGLADLINRNAASAFSLGLVEVALYDMGGDDLAIQPRVIARTQLIERTVVLVRGADGVGGEALAFSTDEAEQAATDSKLEPAEENPKQAAYRAWWAPVIAAQFDDPEQEPPSLRWPNNVRLALPIPGTGVTAYRSDASGGTIGVFVSGKDDALAALWDRIDGNPSELIAELPEGTVQSVENGRRKLETIRSAKDFPDDDAQRAWLAAALNLYSNALRSRLG